MPMQAILLSRTVGLDLIYSFVIVLSSLLIYFSTKELYELSGHKGIKYFRLAFLFFALAYTFRFLTQWILVTYAYSIASLLNPGTISKLALALFMYANTAGILYLWAGVQWKKLKNLSLAIPLIHIIAIGITVLSITTQNLLVLLAIQFFIIVVLAISTYKSDAKKKSILGTYIIYLLLALFWMLNIVDVLIPNFFQTLQLLIYLASLGLFIFMQYKVVKRTGAQ